MNNRKKQTPDTAEKPDHREVVHPLHDRRSLLKAGAFLATGASLDLSLSTAYAASDDTAAAAKLPPQKGDRLQVVKGDLKNKFIRIDSLEVNAIGVEAFPYDPVGEVLRRKNRLNRLVILRLNPDEMDDPTRSRSIDGLLAYSALCTHRNCTIQSWMEKERHLRCHCHLSEFAALSEGSVKGGPARRQLPMVPLGTDNDGFVIAMDGFTRKPGGAKK